MKLKVLVWLAIVLFTTFSVNANGLLNGQITRTGQDIYSATCTVCHSTGVANAPKLQNAQDWELRLGKGFDVLLQNAIAGLGAHPPRGTCLNCSDDEIKSALSYMLEGLLEAPVEDIDTDNDGIIDLSDPDDDNDDIPDTYELANGLDPLDATDAVLDNDSDGLSNYDEFLAGTNLNSADTDQDGINDSVDNNPLVFDEPLPPTNSGVLTVLPDLNDDGIAEIGILNIDSITAKVQLEVLNGKDQSALNVLSWTDNFEDSSLTLHIIPDMNNNGADEVGLFGIQDVANNEGKPQVFVRDLQTGNRVNVYNWPANWQSVSALVLTDISGDGIVEIGIQGRFKEGERPQLVIKNGADGSNEATYSYPNLFNSPMFYQHSDVDGDGFEEIATFGVISRNNKIQVKIANGINSNNKMKAYNFPDKWENISWHRLDDSNNDGVDDWGLFGVSKADGRPQLINKDGTDPTGALRIYAWIADMSNAQFYRIPDMNNDSVDEVAAAGRRSNGRYQFQVQDGVMKKQRLASWVSMLKGNTSWLFGTAMPGMANMPATT
jgi:cytochrome c5